jgi:hypothetical protein
MALAQARRRSDAALCYGSYIRSTIQKFLMSIAQRAKLLVAKRSPEVAQEYQHQRAAAPKFRQSHDLTA